MKNTMKNKRAAARANPDADAVLRSKGYIPGREIAQRLGKDISTVYRWMDSGEVDGEYVMGRRYVLLRSVIVEKVGVKQSVLLGLITEEQAQQFAPSTKK